MADPKRALFANIISSVLTGLLVLIVVIFMVCEPKQVLTFIGFPNLIAEQEYAPPLLPTEIVNELNDVAEHALIKSEPISEEYSFKKFAFRDKLEEKRIAEEKRVAEEKRKAEEAKRKAEAEKKRLEEIALKKKQAEEKKKKEEALRQQKIAEEKKQKEIQAQKDAKAIADKKAAEDAEKKRLADKKAAEDKKKAEDAKKAADAKAKAEADAKAKAEAAENDRIANAYLGNATFVGAMQQALYDNWSTGAEMIGYTATVVFYVDQQGNITRIDDKKSRYSGFQPFDDSVKAAILRTKKIKMPDNKHAINKLVKEGVAVTFDPKDYGFVNY